MIEVGHAGRSNSHMQRKPEASLAFNNGNVTPYVQLEHVSFSRTSVGCSMSHYRSGLAGGAIYPVFYVCRLLLLALRQYMIHRLTFSVSDLFQGGWPICFIVKKT